MTKTELYIITAFLVVLAWLYATWYAVTHEQVRQCMENMPICEQAYFEGR